MGGIYIYTHINKPIFDGKLVGKYRKFPWILYEMQNLIKPTKISSTPRSRKLQGFSCSVAVHEGIVLFQGPLSVWDFFNLHLGNLGGTCRYKVGPYQLQAGLYLHF